MPCFVFHNSIYQIWPTGCRLTSQQEKWARSLNPGLICMIELNQLVSQVRWKAESVKYSSWSISPPADLDKDNNLNIQPGLSSKLSTRIDKNSILSEYQASCMKKGILSEVSTVIKGENSSPPPLLYPSHYRLISECKMKPSLNLQYRVKDLRFDNIVIFLIKSQASYLSDNDMDNTGEISKMHRDMVDDVLRLRGIDFSKVKLPRYDYANQTKSRKRESIWQWLAPSTTA